MDERNDESIRKVVTLNGIIIEPGKPLKLAIDELIAWEDDRTQLRHPITRSPWSIALFAQVGPSLKTARKWHLETDVDPHAMLVYNNINYIDSWQCAPSKYSNDTHSSTSHRHVSQSITVVLAYIDNLHDWSETLGIWNAWKAGRTRGIGNRILHGMKIYAHVVRTKYGSNIEANRCPRMFMMKGIGARLATETQAILREQLTSWKTAFQRIDITKWQSNAYSY